MSEADDDALHAFKVLVPDALLEQFAQDEVELETNAKLVVSAPQEFYPGTALRLIIVLHEDADGCLPVCEKILERIAQLGEEERNNPRRHGGEPDFCGKEPGELVFRVAVATKMSGAIIGSGGRVVQAVRQQTGAKVFVDKNNVLGHQIVKVIGVPEGILPALQLINVHIQADAGSEWYTSWASMQCVGSDVDDNVDNASRPSDGSASGGPPAGPFGRPPTPVPVPAAVAAANAAAVVPRVMAPKAEAVAFSGAVKGGSGGKGSGGGHTNNARSRSPRHSASHKAHGKGKGWAATTSAPGVQSVDQGMIQAIAVTVKEEPVGPELLGEEYCITCDLPTDRLALMRGSENERFDEISEMTGVRIAVDLTEDANAETQTVNFSGPALELYRAHALVMKLYHEAELPPPPDPAEKGVDDIKSEIKELEKQLAMVKEMKQKGASQANTGKQKGAAKSKGKGKTHGKMSGASSGGGELGNSASIDTSRRLGPAGGMVNAGKAKGKGKESGAGSPPQAGALSAGTRRPPLAVQRPAATARPPAAVAQPALAPPRKVIPPAVVRVAPKGKGKGKR